MELLLTILSVLAFWAFLTVLIGGLLLIFKTLDSIKGNLERIAMGVRAIEQETGPFEKYATEFATTLSEAAEHGRGAALRMQDVGRNIDAVGSLARRS